MFSFLEDSPSWAITALVVGVLLTSLAGTVVWAFLIVDLIFPGSVIPREGSLRRLTRWVRRRRRRGVH